MSRSDRFERAIAAIDAANADDPNQIEIAGELRPKELAHAELVSRWVEQLDASASEALRLAARAHHIQRWEVARSEYPQGRAGYHRWRKALHALHAARLGEILTRTGYEAALVERAQAIVQKKGLGRDAEVQTLEDALCLVFVETQLADLAARLERDKLLDVVRKTLRKMSARAIELTGSLPLTEAERALLRDATGSTAPTVVE